MTKPLVVGDWVTGYLMKTGIFRVEKIVPRYYEEWDAYCGRLEGHAIGEEYDPIVIAKRCFKRTDDDGLKRFLGWDCCAAEGCSRVTPAFLQKIEAALEADPRTRKAFEAYQIPPQTRACNLTIRLERRADQAAYDALVPFIREGRTFAEINERLERLRSPRDPDFPYMATFQLQNRDNEMRDKRLVYRDARVINIVGGPDPEERRS